MLPLSIMPSTPSFAGSMISATISLLLVFCAWNGRQSPHYFTDNRIKFLLLLCLIHYVFPLVGNDFFAYKDLVETIGYVDINHISQFYLHLEKPYYYIINATNNNYLFFRTIVWGGSLLLFCLTAKRLGIDKCAFVFYLCLCIVHLTSTSRVCLSYALAFWGYSFIVEPVKRQDKSLMSLSVCIGALLITSSLYFHRSAIFFLLILPLSLININKRTIPIIIISIIIFIVMIRTNLLGFVSSYGQDDNSLFDSNAALEYLNSSKRVFGIGQLILLTLKFGITIVVSILIIKSIISGTNLSWPVAISKLANVVLLINLFATAFLFIGNDATTYKTFERFIDFSYVPQSYFMAYLLSNDLDTEYIRKINLLFFLYIVYLTLYGNVYFAFLER